MLEGGEVVFEWRRAGGFMHQELRMNEMVVVREKYNNEDITRS